LAADSIDSRIPSTIATANGRGKPTESHSSAASYKE
jgi:hypothetical protein